MPKVLLIGSWHFVYPGLDGRETKESDRVNIFSKRRQTELKELLGIAGSNAITGSYLVQEGQRLKFS